MRVSLDFDGVLADTHSFTVELYNEYNGENTSVEEFTDWCFGDSPIVLEDYLEYSKEAWKMDGTNGVSISPMIDHSKGGIKTVFGPLYWSDDVVLDIVTARTEDNREDMEQWLEYWYGHHWYNDFINEKDKASLEYDIYIDDNPSLIGEVDVLYMPERPWNRTVNIEDKDNVYRKERVSDIVTHIERYYM